MMRCFQPPKWLTLRLVILELVLFAVPIILFAIDSRPVRAQGTCSGSQDYGDAPSSSPYYYGIACAAPAANLRIGGTTPTARTYSECTTGRADCDTADNFLNPLTPIDVANRYYTWTIPVSNTTSSAATLAGWIDFNNNKVFDDNERITATVPSIVGGSNWVTLTWSIPITASFNFTTYVRLRISTISNVGPSGDYGNGEVEDYAAWVLKSATCAAGTSFYYIQGTANQGNAIIALVNASTGITTFVNDPPTSYYGTTAVPSINGIAVDQSRALIFYQDAANSTNPKRIFGYNVFANTNFTVTTDASASPLNLPIGTNGWETASGAFANGKYYAGVDGDDTGRIFEITLNVSGTLPVSARLVITPELLTSSCVLQVPAYAGPQCRGYGDLMIDGNRMYATLWQGAQSGRTPPVTEQQYLDVYDINSQLRLSRYAYPLTGFAYQLGRDGNGQIYAVTSVGGRIYVSSQ